MSLRTLLASALILTLSFHANAHAGVAPALGVAGTFTRNDVQRPSTAAECGKINVANTIDSSTAVVAAADGTFTATVTNFNAGGDGSRKVSLKVDATGAGKTFVAGTVQTNGDANPTDVGSQKIVAVLPAGTKCSGGKSKNLCLASFTTTSGFGNCVVVQQGGGSAAAAPPAASSPAPDDATTETATSTTPVAATPAAKAHDCGKDGATPPTAVATPTPAVATPPAPAKAANPDDDATTSGSAAKEPCHKKHTKKHTKASAAGTRAARAARAEVAAME